VFDYTLTTFDLIAKGALGVDNAIRTQSLCKTNPFKHLDSGQRLAMKRLEEHRILFYGNHNYASCFVYQTAQKSVKEPPLAKNQWRFFIASPHVNATR